MSTDVAKRRPFSPAFGDLVTVTKTSLQMSETLSFEDFLRLMRQLTEVGDSMAWWTGDAIEQATVVYGAKYEEALKVMPLEYSTLRNYALVARRFSVLSRRHDNLTFSHHQLVASLDEATASDWLDRAEAEEWSYHELREQLRASRALPAEGGTRITLEQLKLTVPADRAERWKRAADDAGVSFEEWCSSTLDAAADRT